MHVFQLYNNLKNSGGNIFSWSNFGTTDSVILALVMVSYIYIVFYSFPKVLTPFLSYLVAFS